MTQHLKCHLQTERNLTNHLPNTDKCFISIKYSYKLQLIEVNSCITLPMAVFYLLCIQFGLQ